MHHAQLLKFSDEMYHAQLLEFTDEMHHAKVYSALGEKSAMGDSQLLTPHHHYLLSLDMCALMSIYAY